MLQDTTLLQNVAGFGAGAALGGDPAARASIVESSFIENEADGSAGEGRIEKSFSNLAIRGFGVAMTVFILPCLP